MAIQRKINFQAQERIDMDSCYCSALGQMAPCSWCTDPRRILDQVSIDVAQGDELDKIAELWGLVRNPSEPDSDIRYRIRNMAMGDSGGGYIDPNLLDFGDDPPDIAKAKMPDDFRPPTKSKCECGAASLGYTQPGPGHASWCPIASK
jgi:hypothetical protein